MSGITLYKQVAEPAAPDTDSKVVLFINDTGNPAVKYNDGTSAALLRDGDAYSTSVKPVLTYNATGYEGNDIIVTVVNFNDYAPDVTFGLDPQGGSAVISGDTITWTLPDVDIESDYTLDVTARELGKATSTSVATVTVQLIPFTVTGLDITDPADGAIDVKENPTVTAGTPVASDPAYNHVSTSWYVMDGPTVIASSIDDLVNKNSWKIPSGMEVSTSYTIYRRVKMSNGTLIFNIKSAVNGFTTADTFNPWLEWEGSLDGSAVTVESVQRDYPSVAMIDDLHGVLVNTGPSNGTVETRPVSRSSSESVVPVVEGGQSIQINGRTSGSFYTSSIMIDSTHVLILCSNLTYNETFVFGVEYNSGNDSWETGTPVQVFTGNSADPKPGFCRVDDSTAILFHTVGESDNAYTFTRSANVWTVADTRSVTGVPSSMNQSGATLITDDKVLFAYGDTNGLYVQEASRTAVFDWTFSPPQTLDGTQAFTRVNVASFDDLSMVVTGYSNTPGFVASKCTRPNNSTSWDVSTYTMGGTSSDSEAPIVAVTNDALFCLFRNNTGGVITISGLVFYKNGNAIEQGSPASTTGDTARDLPSHSISRIDSNHLITHILDRTTGNIHTETKILKAG